MPRGHLRSVASLGLLALVATSASFAADKPIDFEKQIAPILLEHCSACHNGSQSLGGLNLMTREAAIAGGKSGEPGIKPSDLDNSYLITRIEAGEMPPKGKAKPLSDAELDSLKSWISAGADWPVGRILRPDELTTATRAGRDWWSLRPLANVDPPKVNDRDWARGPIDQFLLAKLEAAKLLPAPLADKRTLLRRVTFDLIGLPPTPDEQAQFLADYSPQAYERVVDRLLASPHYGERWARLWLDVIRFGESHGFERDKQRPNAYRYRDWVIAALNNDLPYDEFIRLQLAGDALRPDDPEAVIATGFLVAGPWDEVGQNQQSAAMKAVVREDEMEDLIGVTSQTFLALTVNCARCHDHKFDPISQVDYYRLNAALSGVRHGERECLSPTGRTAADLQRHEWDAEIKQLERQIAEIEDPVRTLIVHEKRSNQTAKLPQPIAAWDFRRDLHDEVGAIHCEAVGNARRDEQGLHLDGHDGYAVTGPLDKRLSEKTLDVWVSLDNLDQQGGAAIGIQTLDGTVFDSIVFGENDKGRWIAGSNNFLRSKSFAGPPETAGRSERVHLAIVYGSDRTISAYRNGRPYGASYQAQSPVTFEPGKSQVVFGLRHSPKSPGKLLAGTIERAALYDRALTAEEIAARAGDPPPVSMDELNPRLPSEDRARRDRLATQLSWLKMRQELVAGGPVYAVHPQEPPPTRVLARGNPATPGDVVPPGGVSAAAATGGELGLGANAPESERRAKLAAWITGPAAPLAARVMANRLWHYHFGTGIVDTPNDFGFNGGRPSHPELLDWLANRLIAGHWQLKPLQREIVLSTAYRQSGRLTSEGQKADADDRLVWRKNPRRLEAEQIRDALLCVAGQLNPELGGPSYEDFKVRTNNATFYDPVDPVGYSYNRRTIYRYWVRSGTNRLLDVFDCPDPSTTTPRRLTTTTPLQALGLWNDSLVLRMADEFSRRLEREAAGDRRRQIDLAYRWALARLPRPDEIATGEAFVAAHGLPAYCRVLLNCNEFLYVD